MTAILGSIDLRSFLNNLISFYNGTFLYYFSILIFSILIFEFIMDLWEIRKKGITRLTSFEVSHFTRCCNSFEHYSLLFFLLDWVYLLVIICIDVKSFVIAIAKLIVIWLLIWYLWYLPLITSLISSIFFFFHLLKLIFLILKKKDFIIEISFDHNFILKLQNKQLPIFLIKHYKFWGLILLYLFLCPGRKVSLSNLTSFIWIFTIGKPFWFIKNIICFTNSFFEIVLSGPWKRKKKKLWFRILLNHLLSDWREVIILQYSSLFIKFSRSKIMYSNKKLSVNPTLEEKILEFENVRNIARLNRWGNFLLGNKWRLVIHNDAGSYGLAMTHNNKIYFSRTDQRGKIEFETWAIGNQYHKQYVVPTFLGPNLMRKNPLVGSVFEYQKISCYEEYLGFLIKLNLLSIFSIGDKVLFQDTDEFEILKANVSFLMRNMHLTPLNPQTRKFLQEYIKHNEIPNDLKLQKDLLLFQLQIRGMSNREMYDLIKKSNFPDFDIFCEMDLNKNLFF